MYAAFFLSVSFATIVVVLVRPTAPGSQLGCASQRLLAQAERFAGEDFKALRAVLFSAAGLSDLVPMVHFGISPGLPISNDVKWNYLTLMLTMGGTYVLGAALYGAALPERFFPGKVDYAGNAHTIFHVLVLVGAALTWRAVEVLFDAVEEGGFGEICVGFGASAAGSA